MRNSKYKFTNEIDLQIRELYLNKVRLNKKNSPCPVKMFANKVGMPAWKITKRASELGVIPITGSGAYWSKREIEILEESSDKSNITIQRRLRVEGFKRSTSAIISKFKKMSILRNRDGYSASSLAECFGVATRTVISKIKSGKIKAGHFSSKKAEHNIGNSYFITDKEIRKFIIEYIDEIDIRKVDKFWFVSLLTKKSLH